MNNPYTHTDQRKEYIHYYSTVIRKAQRKERIKNQQCATCGIKVKPIKIYPYRCECCNYKNKQCTKRFQDKNGKAK